MLQKKNNNDAHFESAREIFFESWLLEFYKKWCHSVETNTIFHRAASQRHMLFYVLGTHGAGDGRGGQDH